MRISAIVQFALTYAGVVLAEPEIDLLRYYDFGANDEFRDIYAAANGEFAVCGVRGSESGILARMDTEGEIIWLIETWDFMPRSIIEADNGDFIIAGGIEQVAAVMRVSADGGEVLWVETYGETVFNAVIELKSGEFVCCGRTTNVSGRIAAIDANGEIIWNRFYAPLGNIYQDFYALRETDEGVIAVGRAAAGAWIIRCNFEGEQIWNRILNAEVSRHFYSIVSGPNGYALGGIREDRWPWEGYRWAYTSLTGISADGDIQFDEVYPEQVLPGHRNYGVARISDGFVAVGWEIPDIFRGQFLRASHPIAHRTSPNGELVWRKDFHQIVGQVGMGNVTSNKLTSVITLPNNVIVACGSMVSNEEENGDDAIIVRLEPDILGPVVFHKEPEDSLLKVLPGETIDFLVRARNQQGEEMSYQWTYRDTVRSQDTSCTIRFDERGTFPVVCRVTAGEWSVEVVWAVEVTDLFISSFTPDTLDFTIQRANDIAFGIEVVYEGAWENLVMNWELADLAANRREEVGFGLEHVQRFDRTGGYALKAKVFDPNVDPIPADSVQWAIQVRGVIRAFEPNLPEISLEPRQE
ncbi:MAG: hypothetical protein FJY67_09175, partial [Calditrichaeota bacterium]|nr:hypothetical protein [Calditrichota bacterium]